MYPRRDLIALEQRKIHLRGRIAARRAQCREAAVALARPVEQLDHLVAQWRRISPLLKAAALPLGWVLKRALFPRWRIGSSLLRWVPAVFSAWRTFRGRGA